MNQPGFYRSTLSTIGYQKALEEALSVYLFKFWFFTPTEERGRGDTDIIRNETYSVYG
jgi:hypothetical protein